MTQEKSQTMNPNLGEDENEAATEPGPSYMTPPAPNIIVDGVCSACQYGILEEDKKNSFSVECFSCKNLFHAVNCSQDAYCVSSRTSFVSHLRPALENTGNFESRFGKFFFMCDSCCFDYEKKKTLTQDKKVDLIDAKMENMRSELHQEIADLKTMIQSLSNVATQAKSTASSSSTQLQNSVWGDSERTNKLFDQKVLVIKKSEISGKQLDSEILRSACVKNRIQVRKTFSAGEDKVGIVVNSKDNANKLVEELKKSAPDHKIDHLSTKSPTINIIGVPPVITKEDLKKELLLQNPELEQLHTNPSNSDDGKFVIVNISALKSNSSVGRATVGVSNRIREYFESRNDRLYLGNGTCKIYDSFHVKRCFNCQKFGHISDKCTHQVSCGHCAGSHQTKDCDKKESPPVCTNCKTSSEKVHNDNCQHVTSSLDCPILKIEQSKLKNSIPFYQRKKLVSSKSTQ